MSWALQNVSSSYLPNPLDVDLSCSIPPTQMYHLQCLAQPATRMQAESTTQTHCNTLSPELMVLTPHLPSTKVLHKLNYDHQLETYWNVYWKCLHTGKCLQTILLEPCPIQFCGSQPNTSNQWGSPGVAFKQDCIVKLPPVKCYMTLLLLFPPFWTQPNNETPTE